MKLYDGKRTPNGRRVRIFIREKGLPLPDVVEIDIAKKEHYAAGYAALNPRRRLPTLVLDDGTAIAESVAICRYFEETTPQPALFGAGAKERALVEMWNRRMELGLVLNIFMVFRHLSPHMAELETPQIVPWGEANKSKVALELRELDSRLAQSPFVAGDTFSIADITAGIGIEFMRVCKLEIPEGCHHVQRWYEGLKARPSWVL